MNVSLWFQASVAAFTITTPISRLADNTTRPNPLRNVYFGEQHLHTSASPDAFAFGTRNTALVNL